MKNMSDEQKKKIIIIYILIHNILFLKQSTKAKLEYIQNFYVTDVAMSMRQKFHKTINNGL